MRTPEEIARAMEIIAIAASDAMTEKPPDEAKLQSMASGLMALAWARQDGSEMDRMFQKMVDSCNAHDAQKSCPRHRHKN